LDTPVSNTSTYISSGERQRLLLARAVLKRPVALFLDEATSHVDHPTSRKVFKALEQLGTTVVFNTHDRHLLECAGATYFLNSEST
ncbi:MAG: ATP-binding cassette domain-containing protein, partial [Burkholderiales bacterium]